MSTYLSQPKLEELKQELADRQTKERRLIADKIEQAKELGDLSENFEYHAAKEEQAQNETRVIELKDMVQNAVIIEEKTGGDTVGLGTKFIVEINGEEKTYEMVGATETDPLVGKISNESKVGDALLGHKVNDEVEIELPSGKAMYRVVKIL
jgi:transcription elongation factor GreA